MGKPWRDPAPVSVPPELAAAVGGHPLIAAALVRRGITTPAAARAFLDPAHYPAPDPFDLPDLDRAVQVLTAALRDRQPIAVWGDFDVDGQTATSVLVEGLRALGGDIRYHIPLRADGHGIQIPALDALIDGGAQVLLTCDTGITAHDAITHAARRGLTVVITDHHNLPDALPTDAAALVNPKRLTDPAHPLRTLPGVGVAYLLIAALYNSTALYDRAGVSADALRDLVALGIVADVADQVGVTRWLLQTGLHTLTETPRLGLRALLDNAGLTGTAIREEQIGFQIGPRLNALGRLGDAARAVELLTTADPAVALALAGELESLNAERRLLTEQVHSAALALLQREPDLLSTEVLVLAGAGWHPGVLGIVASRLVEAYDRPVILLRLDDDGTARGSARSVTGADIGGAIAASADRVISHGGHTGAAGVRLRHDQIEPFRRAVSRAIRAQGTAAFTGDAALPIEAYVTLADLTPDFAAEIERLAPFGAGNPPLTLAIRDLTVDSTRAIGRTGDHRLVTVRDAAGHTARALWWNGGADAPPADRFDLAVTIRARTYQGRPDVQIEWLAARPASGVIVRSAAARRVIDHRGGAVPALAQLKQQHPDLIVWAEGAERPPEGQGRHALTPASALAIWTPPAGYGDLRTALARVSPAIVYVYAHDPGLNEARAFVERLAGMVKYARSQGLEAVPLERISAALAASESVVRAGLRVLAAQGLAAVSDADDGAIRFADGTGQRDAAEQARAAALLRALLRETALFRQRWLTAPLAWLENDLKT